MDRKTYEQVITCFNLQMSPSTNHEQRVESHNMLEKFKESPIAIEFALYVLDNADPIHTPALKRYSLDLLDKFARTRYSSQKKEAKDQTLNSVLVR